MPHTPILLGWTQADRVADGGGAGPTTSPAPGTLTLHLRLDNPGSREELDPPVTALALNLNGSIHRPHLPIAPGAPTLDVDVDALCVGVKYDFWSACITAGSTAPTTPFSARLHVCIAPGVSDPPLPTRLPDGSVEVRVHNPCASNVPSPSHLQLQFASSEEGLKTGSGRGSTLYLPLPPQPPPAASGSPVLSMPASPLARARAPPGPPLFLVHTLGMGDVDPGAAWYFRSRPEFLLPTAPGPGSTATDSQSPDSAVSVRPFPWSAPSRGLEPQPRVPLLLAITEPATFPGHRGGRHLRLRLDNPLARALPAAPVTPALPFGSGTALEVCVEWEVDDVGARATVPLVVPRTGDALGDAVEFAVPLPLAGVTMGAHQVVRVRSACPRPCPGAVAGAGASGPPDPAAPTPAPAPAPAHEAPVPTWSEWVSVAVPPPPPLAEVPPMEDAQPGTLSALVVVLQPRMEDRRLQLSGLARVADLGVEARNRPALVSVTSWVLGVLDAHPGDPHVALVGLAVLSAISAVHGNRHLLQPVIPAVLACMTAHPEDLHIAVHGLQCLRGVARCDSNRVHLLCCVPAVEAALERWQDDVVVAEYGLRTLHQLTHSDALREGLGVSCLPRVPATMTAHPTHRGVAEAGLLCLRGLSASPHHLAALAGAGIPDIVVQLLRLERYDSGEPQPQPQPEVSLMATAAIELLANVSSHTDEATKEALLPAATAVEAVLGRHRGDPAPVATCLTFLANLSVKATLAGRCRHLIPLVVEVLTLHQGVVAVVEPGVCLLAFMAFVLQSVPLLREAGVGPLVEACISRHRANTEVRDWGVTLLGKL